MKIFLMTDMEGVCGVINVQDWCEPNGRYYEEGKKLLTEEVNAAVEGFFAGGATEIMVVDGHGAGGLKHICLDKRTTYSRGWDGPYPFGLDSSFNAIAFVGQHAKAGSEFAHIAHTGSFNVLDYHINGISVGEFGHISLIGSVMKVPVIFGSGDNAFTQEAKALIPSIETVVVKRGVTPGKGDECSTDEFAIRNLGAIHLHPEKARQLIREGAEKAVRRYLKSREFFTLIGLKPPYIRTVKYRRNVNEGGYTTHSEHPSDIVSMMNSIELRV